MSNFPYETISAFFEDQGDFEENLEPDALDQQRQDAIDLRNEFMAGGFEDEEDPRDIEVAPYRDQATGEIDPEDPAVKWFLNEEGTPYPYPARLQAEHYPNDFHTPYASEEEAEAGAAALGYVDEPCCYNSSRNFGTGEHEYGCPNY